MEEGEYRQEEGEDGKNGKNGKEVRLGMATREAGRVRNKGGGRQISHKRRMRRGKGEEEEEEYHVSWRLGVLIYIVQ
jgi:hypothetical protein